MRKVTEIPRDLELWKSIILKMQGVPNFLSKSEFKNITAFLDERNRFYLIDDVGVAVVFPERWSGQAHCHITFWDRKLRGREDLCRLLCRRVAANLELLSLVTAIPVQIRTTIAFAKRIGFEEYSQYNGVVWLRFND